MSHSREYHTWAAIKARCLNPGNIAYRNYGGRGITICKRWLNSFDKFYADMGPRPKGHSIDRRDPNKNYSPSNCYWATALQQGTNKRTSHYITFKNQKLTISEWGRKIGISASTISIRLKALGWSIERALTTPLRKRNYDA